MISNNYNRAKSGRMKMPRYNVHLSFWGKYAALPAVAGILSWWAGLSGRSNHCCLPLSHFTLRTSILFHPTIPTMTTLDWDGDSHTWDRAEGGPGGHVEAHVYVPCSLEGEVDCSLTSPASARCQGCHSHSCCWRHSWLLQSFPQTVVTCLLLLTWQTPLLWDEDAAACGHSRWRRASLHWVLAHKVTQGSSWGSNDVSSPVYHSAPHLMWP